MREGARPPREGFTLAEVIVALVILQVGMIGCLGMLVVAHRRLALAERLHTATQAAAGVADSLFAAGAAGAGLAAGEAVATWVTVRWEAGEGGVRLVGEDPSGAALVDWWIPLDPAP